MSGHVPTARPFGQTTVVRPSDYIDALVCGRSQHERDSTLIAMLSVAHIDETGMGMDLPIFGMGGFLATVDTWKSFSDAWQTELELPPSLPPISMKDLYARRKGFEGIDGEEMYRRLSRLAGITVRHDVHAFVLGISTNQWKSEIEDKLCRCLRKRHKHPYEFMSQTLAIKLLEMGDYVRADFGQIDIVFDWQAKLGLKTKKGIDNELPLFLQRTVPALSSRLGELHWPRDRTRYKPLQAADILMWQYQRVECKNSIPTDAILKQLVSAKRVSGIIDMHELVTRHSALLMAQPCRCQSKGGPAVL